MPAQDVISVDDEEEVSIQDENKVINEVSCLSYNIELS
jgi:hypothetical protein